MQPESLRRRIPSLVAAAIVIASYAFFTLRSVSRYFDNDDMMNLYFAWSRPLSQVYRPVGALFYRWMFAVAGFHPEPFRIACLVLGLLNLALCWRFVGLVSGSGRVAALAALLFAFQSRLVEVWFRTAVVYDLLCFTFFYSAACLYIAQRKAGRMPGVWVSLAILVCFLCALGSKEVAIMLPAVLVAYEICFERLVWRRLWEIAILAAIDVPYLYLKMHGPGALASIPDYRPVFSMARFSGTWALYVKYLFVLSDDIPPRAALTVLLLMFVLAAALRWRQLLFAWALLFTATVPVLFLAARGGYVLYIAYVGWVLYAAVLLTGLEVKITTRLPRYREALFWIVFVAVGWWWGKRNLHDQRIDPRLWLWDSPRQVRALADQTRALAPRLPAGAKILFLDDPFETDEWTPYFVLKLMYRDDSMRVDRVKLMAGKTPDLSSYGWVFGYRAGKYWRVK